MQRRLTAISLIALIAAGSAAVARAQTASVVIKDIDFSRPIVTIHRGDSVRWRFADDPVSHNVTSRGPKRFRSSPSMRRGTYSVRFRRAGTYRYVCTIHPSMKGRVVVR